MVGHNPHWWSILLTNSCRERNLPPPPNAFIKYGDHDHTEKHAEKETIEELDILLPEDRARLGKGYRLSPKALSALKDLVIHAQGAKNFVDAVSDKGESGDAWEKALKELRSKGIDTTNLETDIQGKKFSEYTPQEKEALVENFEGSFWEHMDMRARGIVEEEVSEKRDREDGVYR
jgi:hypothetical protein